MKTGNRHKVFDKRLVSKNEGFTHCIKLPWDSTWNESCADIMEVFGLPGDKFKCHPKPQSMEVYFKSKKDAELCKILLSHQL